MPIIADNPVDLTWPAEPSVGLGGEYRVYINDGLGGAVSFATSVNPRRIPAYPDDGSYAASGFGMGPFGEGGFGYGPVGGPFGDGFFGAGAFGYGTFEHTYTTKPIDDGTYTMALVGYDAAGNGDTAGAPTAEVEIAGIPEPPGVPAAAAYVSGTDTLTLTWDLSPDDTAA